MLSSTIDNILYKIMVDLVKSHYGIDRVHTSPDTTSGSIIVFSKTGEVQGGICVHNGTVTAGEILMPTPIELSSPTALDDVIAALESTNPKTMEAIMILARMIRK